MRSMKSAPVAVRHSSCSSHDCRPETVKYHKRNPLHDTSILARGLYQTTKSTIVLNEKYLFYQRNLIDKINENLFRKYVYFKLN